VTELAEDERSHRWPWVLPGTSYALFTNWTGSRFDVEVVNLETKERRRLIENGSNAKYAPTGHLVFLQDEDLMAVPFDAHELEIVGEPIGIVDNVHRDERTGAAFFDFSHAGTLTYVPEAVEPTSEVSGLVLRVDRTGAPSILVSTPRGYQVPRLSPSGGELLVTITDDVKTDVWSMDTSRTTTRRLTFQGNNGTAIWTPDGKRVTFTSDREGALNLFWQPLDGSESAERLTSSPNAQFPNSWTRDGTKLAYTELDPEAGFDIWVLSIDGFKTVPFLQTDGNESAAVFSPDGRFLAYVSDETGTDEVYVRAYPGPGGKWTISSGGGREPVWSRDGSEIYYRSQDWLVAVPIETEPELQPGKPQNLFEAPFDEAGAPYANFDTTPDGTGFTMVRSEEELASTRLIVVVNWFEELRRRVPNPSEN
jgi:serine/threonine-protein kinase